MKRAKELCVLIASSFPFLFTLSGDFVFDDSEAVINNKDVSSGSWVNAFHHDFWGEKIRSNISHKSYRPLTVLSFRTNYYLNNKRFSAFQFKATNLIFHITCCFVLWWTFRTILKSLGKKEGPEWYNDVAFLAALLFAVHPVHTEAVSGIVGRADLLAANTFFLAFLCYKKAMPRSKHSHQYLCCTIILAAISLLFKENGVTVLGFCICYELIMKFNMNLKKRKAKSFRIYIDLNTVSRIICCALAALVLLYGRWTIMGGTKPRFQSVDNPAAFSDSLFTKVATYNYIYFLNITLLVWPQWLCYDWSMGCVGLIKSAWDYRILFILLMYLYGALVLLTIFNVKNNTNTKKLFVIAISLAVIPFLPASNLFYPVGFVIAERVLYISSAGYCLFLALGLQKIIKMEKSRYKVSVVFFCYLILIFGLRSWKRSKDWRNEYRLYTSGYSVCPLNAKVHYNIAKVADGINPDWAFAEYKEAIWLHPGYYQAMNNLANMLKNQERYAEAEAYFKIALKTKPDFPAAWMNLGIVLANVNRIKESEAAYKMALSYRKDYVDCFYNMGNLYLQQGKSELAIEHWLEAIRRNPTYVIAWTNILAQFDETEQFDRAEQLIPKALEKVPNAPSVNFAIATIYGKIPKYEESEKYFKRAIELFGSDVKAVHYGNLGVLYHRWRKHDLAEEAYAKALKLDPTYKIGLKNLKYLRERLERIGESKSSLA